MVAKVAVDWRHVEAILLELARAEGFDIRQERGRSYATYVGTIELDIEQVAKTIAEELSR